MTELRTEDEVGFSVVAASDVVVPAPVRLLDDVRFTEDEDDGIEEEEV